MCQSPDLERYLDLGLTPLADEFRTREQAAAPQVVYPLEVYLCVRCGLSQLGLLVAPELLYQQDYPYESSTTQAGRRHFTAFAHSVAQRFGLGANDLAVDIGSNVGVLVKGFLDAGVRGLGVDPAPNIVERARAQGIDTICDFFGPATADTILAQYGPAAVITGTNVFAHIHDLDPFMDAVSRLLSPHGVFIIEAPHFLQLVRNLEYDTIYHEHVSYLSIKPMTAFFQRHGLEVFDVVHADIHGGSIRVFVGRQGRWPVMTNVEAIMGEEQAAELHDLTALRRFADQVAKHRQALLALLLELRRGGKRIAGVSAPAKGMTLLNYCGIGPGLLEFVTEKSPLKIGRFTPGGRLPVYPDAALWERGMDYGLLLAWNFADEIMRNLSQFADRSGKFIIPIPSPRVV